MTTLLELYEYAESQGIDVDWVPMVQATSLSIPLPDGSCSIAVNPWKLDTLEQETVCLAHEQRSAAASLILFSVSACSNNLGAAELASDSLLLLLKKNMVFPFLPCGLA